MKDENNYPVVPLKGTVLFPEHILPFAVEHTRTLRAVEAAASGQGKVFVVAVRNEGNKDTPGKYYEMGVIAQVGLSQRGPGDMPMILQGLKRARVSEYNLDGKYPTAKVEVVEQIQPANPDDASFKALFKETREKAKELGLLYGIPEKTVDRMVNNARSPGTFTDQIAGLSDMPVHDKQDILESLDVEQRMRQILIYLEHRIGMLRAQEQIKSEVQEKMGKRQREMYLREQLKAIQDELGEGDEGDGDLKALREQLGELSLPENVQKEVDREFSRLERSGPGSHEAQVSRTYLEWIAELPWNRESDEKLDLKRAQQILDEDHYGLKDVKDRILEFLAVRQLRHKKSESSADSNENKERKSPTGARGPILLFSGPPGVGKTSIAKSIARALGREYVRVALGGTRDEADIRGHRRTYVGAMPGRIVQGLKQAGTKNPVFLLDEVDKLGVSYQGDPSSALMEVLDPAQNDSFQDHYLNVPFDLSEVLFIATANFVQNIPGPLLDRMEVVEFTGYTEYEKLEIAKGYLIPRQLEENGIDEVVHGLSDSAIRQITGHYTRESGVRQLEREIGRLMRKVARRIAVGEELVSELSESLVEELLGKPKIRQERIRERDEVGVATGMYYTPAGGDIMFVEASIRELTSRSLEKTAAGEGLGAVSLILTGQLGDVMKESARAAMTYATTHAFELDIPPKHLGAIETHIHVPAGAIPKDGPSAGVTMATALVSAMSGRAVRKDVSMTGEITLHGSVMPIGGLKEKVLGAQRAGIKEIILPKENENDLGEIPNEIRETLIFHTVKTLDEVLEIALKPVETRNFAASGLIGTADGTGLDWSGGLTS